MQYKAPLSTYNAIPNDRGSFQRDNDRHEQLKLYKGTNLELVYGPGLYTQEGKQNIFGTILTSPHRI